MRFLLSGGKCFDGKARRAFAQTLAAGHKTADKAYDGAAFRDWLARRGTTPVIPNKINRRKPFPYNKRAYRHRNKIARMFCRLKDARRIATRYEKCAENFLSAVCLIRSNRRGRPSCFFSRSTAKMKCSRGIRPSSRDLGAKFLHNRTGN